MASKDDMNVKVAVRLRPFNTREKDLDCTKIIEMDGPSTYMINPSAPDKEPRSFAFDFSYDWDVDQDVVYKDIAAPIVSKAFDGFNGTIFAYGQTGSGKSWSMMGAQDASKPELDGIIPRLNQDLFLSLAAAKEKEPDKKFMILVSYLEIYNEVVKDLLNPSDKKLEIRQHPKLGVYVQDLAEIVVESADSVNALIEGGNKVRQVASTQMNARSSRSHSCFTIKVEQQKEEDLGGKRKTTKLNAKINLVDLAGSERQNKTGATGARLKEGAAINKSLTVLGQVINALAEGKPHIPYRDSKLTRLLQNSLGGNSHTMMVAAISPASDNYDETLSTLNYANRAKNIKNVTKRNEDVSQQIIRELRGEIDSLRAALEAAQAGVPLGGAMSAEEQARIDEMKEKMSMLERAKQESWEEKQRLSQLYEEERKKNSQNEAKIKAYMNTVKEDNMALIRHMKELLAEQTSLNGLYKEKRALHSGTRSDLKNMIEEYQELVEDGGEDGPNAGRIAELVAEIEPVQTQAEEEAAELKEIKTALKEVAAALDEARDEAAAQRMMLEEDAELRASIQAEERAKLQSEHAARFEAALAEEKSRLQEQMEAEKAKALQAMGGAGGGAGDDDGGALAEKVSQLEMALLDAKQGAELLRLELTQTAQRHGEEMQGARRKHEAEMAALKSQELKMFRELCDGFEEEHRTMRKQLGEKTRLLRQAVADITFLQSKTGKLERQLVEAAAWEPTM